MGLSLFCSLLPDQNLQQSLAHRGALPVFVESGHEGGSDEQVSQRLGRTVRTSGGATCSAEHSRAFGNGHSGPGHSHWLSLSLEYEGASFPQPIL